MENVNQEVNENINVAEYQKKWNKSVLITVLSTVCVVLLIIILNLFNDFIYQVIGRTFVPKTSNHYLDNAFCEKVGLIIFITVFILGFALICSLILINKKLKVSNEDIVWFVVKGTKREEEFKNIFEKEKHEFSREAKFINILKNVLDYYLIVLLAILTVIVIFSFILFPAEVNQSSMEETLYDGNRVVVRVTKKIEKGDIVVFEYSSNIQKEDNRLNKDLLIKRVIATSGDTFRCENGNVYVNDILLEEDYVHPYNVDHSSYDLNSIIEKNTNYEKIKEIVESNGGKVPDGYVICLGDNRNISNDSENFGLVKVNQILGKVIIYKNDFGWNKVK